MKIAAVMALASLAACVQPQAPDTPLVGTLSYTCTGGAILPVTYTTDPNGNTAVVIAAFGTNYNLIEEASTGGRRFSWPSDGTHFVWLVSGNVGTLLSHDGVTGSETPSLTGCKAPPPAV